VRFFAISDLHLSFGTDKPMDVFGPHWDDHPSRLRRAWLDLVGHEDVVLVPGDISWAMRPAEAEADLSFLHGLPGTKVIIKGNHDYWWSTLGKLRQTLPGSIIPLQNSSVSFGDVTVAGSRLWTDPELSLEDVSEEDRRIFARELGRLRLSLDSMQDGARVRIVMTHFPPLSLDGRPGKAVEAAAGREPDIWVFGHMHLGGADYSGFTRTIGRTRFVFVSADHLGFAPLLILDSSNP